MVSNNFSRNELTFVILASGIIETLSKRNFTLNF
jgi:hypothetical protein